MKKFSTLFILFSFTVVCIAVPKIAMPDPVCINSTLNLSAPNGATTYVWTGLGVTAVNAATTTAVPTISGSTIYTVTVTTNYTGVSCSSISTKSVVVNANPVVSITGLTEICVGDSTQLSPISGGTWVSSHPSIASVSDDGKVKGLSDGSATFTFTDGTTGCTNVTSAVTIKPIPTGVFVAGNTVCINSMQTASLSGITPATISNYNWQGNGIVNTNSSSTTFTPNEAGSQLYSVALTGTNGCIATLSKSVNVLAIPSLTIGNIEALCANAGQMQIPFSSVSGNPNSYNVSAVATTMPGFTNISNASFGASPLNINIPTGLSPGTYNFELVLRNSFGTGSNFCASGPIPFSVTVPVSTILYVDSSVVASGDGLSWASAVKTMQEGLSKATSCNTFTKIYVAKGTYFPNAGNSFSMLPNMAILGGFPTGGAPNQSDRNWVTNQTILKGNGSRVIHNNNVNLSSNNSSLNGFIVSSGIVNSAGGAGILVQNGSSTFENCFIVNNTATSSHGGGISVLNNTAPRFVNCVIANNTAENGDGLYIDRTGIGGPTLVNCTVAQNGNEAIFFARSNLGILNSIIWGGVTGSPSFTNSIVEGATISGGVIGNADPMFENSANPVGPDGKYGTNDDGLMLKFGSPGRNAGNNIFNTSSLDISHNNRIESGTIDLGAYEISLLPPTNKLFVDASISSSSNGANWLQSFKTLTEAITYAESNLTVDTILVAEGTYSPSGLAFSSERTLTFKIRGNLTLLGGYPSGGGSRNFTNHESILTGVIDNNVPVNRQQSRGNGVDIGNSYHVVSCINTSDPSIIDGFTIKEGVADGIDSNSVGAGVYIKNATLSLKNVIIKNNFAKLKGSGIHSIGGSVTVEDSKIIYNEGPTSPNPISTVHFTGNGTRTINRSNISHNTGMGIVTDSSGIATVMNSLLTHNSSYVTFVVNDPNELNLINNTIADNGNGFYQVFGQLNVYNNIVADNGPGFYTGVGNIFNYTNNVMKNINSSGNIYADPLFVDQANENYNIICGSPARNAGQSMYNPTSTHDLALLPRYFGGALDIGAYENQEVAGKTTGLLSRGTFKNAVYLACPTDIINMDAVSNYSEMLSDTLHIDKELTLKGQGLSSPSITVDKVLKIDSGKILTIQDLKFISPYILNSGKLKLSTSDISGSSAPNFQSILNKGNLEILSGVNIIR